MTNHKTELPTPIYAAAGAGELAYQQLRKLPEAAARTMRNAGQLRQRLADPQSQLNVRMRESAERGRSAVRSRAVAAQQRAAAGYRNLVARGERVVAERTNGSPEQSQVEVIVGPVQPSVDAPGQEPTPGQSTGSPTA
jgi:hypothetical protein